MRPPRASRAHLTRSVAPRLVLAGVVSNAAVGSLFAWSLVAGDAARDVGLRQGGGPVVFGAAIAVLSVVLLVAGRVAGRLDPRLLLLLAAASGAAGLLVASWWDHPLALWCGVAGLFGTANGLAYSVATALAARVPFRHRGSATGLVVAAYAAAPVLLGVIGPPLVAEHGWRSCTATLGLVVGGLLLLGAAITPATRREQRGRVVPVADARRTRGAVPRLWVVFAGGSAPALMVFAHAVPIATMRQLDSGGAGLAVAALAGGNLAGRVLAGWISDRLGRLPSLAAALTVSALAVVGLGSVAAPGGLLVCFGGLGLAYGALSALVPAATADVVGSTDFPWAYARVFSAWGVAGLTAPIAGVWLVRDSADAPLALVLMVLPLVPAGLALASLARSNRRAPPTRRPSARR